MIGVMGKGRAADLLPIVSVENGYFVLTDGRLVAAFECTGTDLAAKEDTAADQVAQLFGRALNVLPPESHLQLLVVSNPLRAEEWVPRHLAAEYDPPPHLRGFVRIVERWLREQLAGGHVDNQRNYWLLSMPGAPGKMLDGLPVVGGDSRRLQRDREQHLKAVRQLERVAREFTAALEEAGISSRPLDMSEILALQWESCNDPDWSHGIAPVGHVAHLRADGSPNPVPPFRPDSWRSLRNRLAQSIIKRRTTYLRVHRDVWETHCLRDLPDQTISGWMAPAVRAGVRCRLAIHIFPEDKPKQLAALTARWRRRHAVVKHAERNPNIVPDLEQLETYEEETELIREQTSTDLRLFKVAAYYTTHGRTPDEASAAARILGNALGSVGGNDIDRCPDVQDLAWQATLPLAYHPPKLEYVKFPAKGYNLGDSLPYLANKPGTPGGFVLGFSDPGHAIVQLDPRDPDLQNKNMALAGFQGSGKTFLCQYIALATVARGERVLILDRSTGHYDDLARVVGGQVHYVGFDGGISVNPFDLPPGAIRPDADKLLFLGQLHTLMLGETRDGVPYLTPNETAAIEAAFREVYKRVERPHERDLYEYLASQESALHRSLAERLTPYVGDGAYAQLIDRDTTLRPDSPMEVFNFSAVRRDDLIPLVMVLLIDYLRMVTAATPCTEIKDEVWFLLSNPVSARYVTTGTRTGRHIDLVNINATQRVDDYLTETGKTILDGCSTKLVLKMPDSRATLDNLQHALDLTTAERDRIGSLQAVKGSHSGAYIHTTGGVTERGFVRIQAPPPLRWLFASNNDERALRRRAIERNGGDIWAAVQELADCKGVLSDDDLPPLRVVREG